MTSVQENLNSGVAHEYEPQTELVRLYDLFGNGNQLHSSERIMATGLDSEQAQQWLAEKVAQAKVNGKFTALVAGGFDVPHDCHEWYLRHCRMLAAEKILKESGQSITQDTVLAAMNDENLCMIVSIDSDAALQARKGGQAEKGGIPRPVYPWQTRAHRIAGYSYEHPAAGTVHTTADIISRECTQEYSGTPLQNAVSVASWLKSYDLLDSYIVIDEHPHDIANAREIGFDPIVVPHELVYARDPRTQKEYRSSDIIKSIRHGYVES